MCATFNKQSGCKNAVEVRSLKDPGDFFPRSDVSKMSKSSPVCLVYHRRKYQGTFASTSEQTQVQTYQGVDPHDPAISNKKSRASQVQHEAGHSGQCLVHKIHNLVYHRRKFRGKSADISEWAQRQAYQSLDPHYPAKPKEICRASQVDHETDDYGQCFVHKNHNLVYHRRKFRGKSIDILDQAQRQVYQRVDPHYPAKPKEIFRASQVDHEAGNSGQYIGCKVQYLVYCRRKFRGKSADISVRAQRQAYQDVDPHYPAKSEICRASKIDLEAGDSGQCFVRKVPYLVYCRRKFGGKSGDISIRAQRQAYQDVDPHYPAKPKEICRASQVDHKAGDSRHCFVHTIHDSGEASKNISQSKEMDGVNDYCSSSKLNLEPISVSMRAEVDDCGECSSSCTIAVEDTKREISAKELCISVLKNAGLLKFRSKSSKPVEDGVKSSHPCKLCGKSEVNLKMLICDNCEEAFHINCCSVRVKKIPNEWFCISCLKLKRNFSKETCAIKKLHISREQSRCSSPSRKDQLDNIALLLEYTGPYRSSVGVGKDFQADIPDWLGPANYKADAVDEPLVIDTFESESLSLQKSNSTKNSGFSSIGNWLQCRETIDGVGHASGSFCGKWRRAPLSEVQTDNWECFCSVFWDHAHADCNVAQELETDQVLKQLKYIEMLRPRLAAKRRKKEKSELSDHG